MDSFQVPHSPAYERIKQVYFSDPERRILLQPEQVLLEQGEHNERLYLILSGTVVGCQQLEEEGKYVEIFRSGLGMFIGLQSFFSSTYTSYSRVIAESETELAYIDINTPAVDEYQYGSFIEQFNPVIVHALVTRQIRATHNALEKEKAMGRLLQAEKMTLLGQLSAGLAHELNNSVGVVARKADTLSSFFYELLKDRFPKEFRFFAAGLETGQLISSREMRKRAREFEQQLGVGRDTARMIARIAPSLDDAQIFSKGFLNNLDMIVRYWELGRDFHDMQVAVHHAGNIVKSVKLLGGGDYERSDHIDVHESIDEALSLLKSNLREVGVELSLAENLPSIYGNKTELVQVWVNIIKNAYDAMIHAKVEKPSIVIKSHAYKRHIQVSITDNGPGIPDDLIHKIFQPNFTTKKDGLSFGLGLGLSIVLRLVESYSGEVSVKSVPGKTTFKFKLPIEDNYGKA